MSRPTRPRLSECQDCREPIRFVRLDTGKPIAVNPQPNNRGNVAALLIGRDLHGHVVSRKKPIQPRMELYMPHIATCEERQPAPKPAPPPTLFD